MSERALRRPTDGLLLGVRRTFPFLGDESPAIDDIMVDTTGYDYGMGYENSLFTDVFPSWFFFRTCPHSQRSCHTPSRPLGTNLCNRKLKVFLRDMLSPLAQRVHP